MTINHHEIDKPYPAAHCIINPKKNVNLYDLTKDTRENFNIAKECPDLVNKMEHLLTEITTDDLPEYNIEEMTKKEKKEINDELRRLGYV